MADMTRARTTTSLSFRGPLSSPRLLRSRSAAGLARRTRAATLGLLLVPCLLLVAAAPQLEGAPDELIRRANAAFSRGDRDEAERLYAAAEERTADPGLVGFNCAAVLFQQEKYYDAERHYARVLDDAACPPDRAAKAWYNRGTCLIRRGGSAAVYRSAIACLERCLDSDAADEPLKADARHNLELAKVLWNEARKKENKPHNPNEDLPQEDPRSEPPPPQGLGGDPQLGDPEQGADGAGGSPVPKHIPQTAAAGAKAQPVQAQTPAVTPNLQPLQDDRRVQPLSPEETRDHLRRTAERLRREQQQLRQALYGQERAGVHDW